MTALALREDQTAWDAGQLAVLQSSGIDKDVSEPELTAFLHECQRRRLDPFTRQIYLIGRYSKRERRKVYRSQTSIDGFRLIARRAADSAKETIEYEETTWYDDGGKGQEVWLGNGYPAACKVVVLRGGKRFPVVARFAAYVQTDSDGRPSQMWQKMPDIMIAKCAEALALRMAFPEELGGIYTDEEMGQADNPQRVQAVSVETVPDEPCGPSVDHEWVSAALEMAGKFADDAAGRVIWDEVITRRDHGKIVTADAERIKSLVRARWKELAAAEPAQSAPVQGTVVPGLDPEDPWALRVEEIASAEDAGAVSSEVGKAISDGTLDDEKGAAVFAAVAARESALTQQAAA